MYWIARIPILTFLSGKAIEGVWPAYDSVKKWTKNVDIFKKDYIVVPINERQVRAMLELTPVIIGF
jgi:hypothetical protein